MRTVGMGFGTCEGPPADNAASRVQVEDKTRQTAFSAGGPLTGAQMARYVVINKKRVVCLVKELAASMRWVTRATSIEHEAWTSRSRCGQTTFGVFCDTVPFEMLFGTCEGPPCERAVLTGASRGQFLKLLFCLVDPCVWHR